ncbi:hypothetical protein J6590_022954 [Homalodisca vitripennis]|nr:hypothetical protein J6590_022954 [Homalodisca vitripennis]
MAGGITILSDDFQSSPSAWASSQPTLMAGGITVSWFTCPSIFDIVHRIVQSRTEVDLTLTDFDKDKREAIVSLPRKMLVKYTTGNNCQHQKSSTIFNNKKYTEENSV